MDKVKLSTDASARERISNRLIEMGFSQKVSNESLLLDFESKGFLIGRLDKPNCGFLSYFFVEERFRNQGIGSALIETFVIHAKAIGLSRLTIPGFTGNAPGYLQPGINLETEQNAIKLVDKFGFVEIGRVFSMNRSLDDEIHVPSNFEWKLRQPNLSDRDLIQDAIANSVPGEWSILFDERLKAKSHEMLIVLHSNAVVAYSSWSYDRFGPIGVRPEYRGKGLGKFLLAHSLSKMRDQGCRRAWFTWSDQENLNFYKSFGFKVTSSFARFTLDLQ